MPRNEWKSTRVRHILQRRDLTEVKYDNTPSGIEGASDAWLDIILRNINTDMLVRSSDKFVLHISSPKDLDETIDALDFFLIEGEKIPAKNPRFNNVSLDQENMEKLLHFLYHTSEKHQNEKKCSDALRTCKEIAQKFFPEKDIVAERNGKKDHPNISQHRTGGKE